jgi:hypothetical protein
LSRDSSDCPASSSVTLPAINDRKTTSLFIRPWII